VAERTHRIIGIPNRENKQNQQLPSGFPSSLPKACRPTDAAVTCYVWSSITYHLGVRLS
jgi:hypothetical protein